MSRAGPILSYENKSQNISPAATTFYESNYINT
jgi:hypothetical protein